MLTRRKISSVICSVFTNTLKVNITWQHICAMNICTLRIALHTHIYININICIANTKENAHNRNRNTKGLSWHNQNESKQIIQQYSNTMRKTTCAK